MGVLASGAAPLPGFLNSLAGPLDHYGYWAIALLLLLENIGVPVVPGELALIAGAIFAGTGRAGLNVVLVGVVAVTVTIAGAEIGYLIGKYAGRELILHYGKYVMIKPHHLDRAEAVVSRYGGIVVVIARYIVGLREANGIIAGITQMRWLTFGWFNVLGACAWVATWVSIGYLAGGSIDTIYRDVNRYALYVLLALAVLLAAYIIRRVARRRRREGASAEASETERAPVTEEDSDVEVRGFHGAGEHSEAEEGHEVVEVPVAQEGSRTEDDEAGEDEAGEDEAREDEAREDEAREDEAREDEAGEDSTTQESP